MAIERGREWGRPGELEADAVSASSDADLAAAITRGATHVRATGGDLARTLGVSPASLARPAQMLLPVDAIEVELDDTKISVAAAHVVIGTPLRRATLVMNAAFRGDHNLAPRAHPGDGRLDIVHFDLALGEWFKARTRLATGTHVPHPDISLRRAATFEARHHRPVRVSLDSAPAQRACHIRCRVIPAAVTIGV